MKFKHYLDIDWPKSTENIEYKECMTEDEELLYRSNWSIQKQFWCILYEYYDKKTNLKIVTGGDFSVLFKVSDIEYIYQVSKRDDIWVILFYPIKRGVGFGNIKGNNKFNEVIAALFQATQLLIDTHNVKEIGFSTDDIDLINIYDNLIRYIEKRLPVKYIKSEIKNKNRLYYFSVINNKK